MTNKGSDGEGDPARHRETAAPHDERDNGRAPVSAVGAVIDLVSARTRRAFRKKEAEANSKVGNKWGDGGKGQGTRAGASAGSGRVPVPGAQASLGFKAARVLQIVVLIAGILYLMRSCGYL